MAFMFLTLPFQPYSGFSLVGWASVFLLARHWGGCGFRSAWADGEAVCPPYRACPPSGKMRVSFYRACHFWRYELFYVLIKVLIFNMTFDLSSFISTLLSALIGVVTSWIIAHWYYRKTGPVERMLKEIKSALPTLLHPVIYPQFYGSDAVTVSPSQSFPKDLDIPHIEYAVLSKRTIFDGDFLEVLLKLRDMGRNLENPSGIRVRDHLERDVAVRSNGLGFASVTFRADLKEDIQKNYLTVTLEDASGKRNTQSIPFFIHSR